MHDRKYPIVRNLLLGALLFLLVGLLISPRTTPAAIRKSLEVDTIVAQGSGRPLLSTNWFAEGRMGVLSYTLIWAEPIQPLISTDFQLAKASGFRWLTPELPEGCRLYDVKGQLNRREKTPFHGLSLTLRGRSCETFLENFGMQQPVQLEFQEVPHLSPTGDKGVTPLLVLKIQAERI